MANVVALTAPNLVDALSSANDKTLLFQQDGHGDHSLVVTPAHNGTAAGSNSGGNVFRKQANILDADIAVQGAKIAVPYKTGNAASTKMAQGSVNIANGIQVLASADYGLEWLYRNWCQDKNPSYEYRGGGSYPAAHTVVASAALHDTRAQHTIVAIPNTIKYVVQPKITLSGSPTIDSNKLYGVVYITGTDVNGRTVDAQARWTTPQLASTPVVQLPEWVRTVTKVESEGFTAGNIVVSVEDLSTDITYVPQDLILVDFVSLEYDYGGLVPFSFRDLVFETINANIARDTVATYGIGVLGGVAGVRENISGGADPTPTPAGVERASTEIFIGTECYVEIDGQRFPMTGATINGAQGNINADYLDYDLWQTGKPRRNAKRTLSINCTVQASVQNDFNSLFFQNATLPDVKFVQRAAARGTYAKYDSLTEWHMFQCEIESTPSIQSAGESAIPQTVVLKAFDNDGNPEFNIKSSQPSYAADSRLYHYA